MRITSLSLSIPKSLAAPGQRVLRSKAPHGRHLSASMEIGFRAGFVHYVQECLQASSVVSDHVVPEEEGYTPNGSVRSPMSHRTSGRLMESGSG